MTIPNPLSFRPISGPASVISHKLSLRNGGKIPQLGFGTYCLSPTDAEDAVTFALSCGYRHFDCAKAYRNEMGVGSALQSAMRTRRVRREDIFVTSKLWPTDQHPDHVEAACRESLRSLQLDYLDLYLIHWPVCLRHTGRFSTDDDKYPRHRDGKPAIDTSVTLMDTWRAMSELVEKGLVRSIGLSNCHIDQIHTVMQVGEVENLHLPVLNQVEVHPSLVDSPLAQCHGSYNMLTAAYCPLAASHRSSDASATSLLQDPLLISLSERIGYSPARILLNWNVDRNNVVLVRSSKKEHIKSNAKAARFALDDSTRMMLDSYRYVVRHQRCINPTHFTSSGEAFFKDIDAGLQREIDSLLVKRNNVPV